MYFPSAYFSQDQLISYNIDYCAECTSDPTSYGCADNPFITHMYWAYITSDNCYYSIYSPNGSSIRTGHYLCKDCINLSYMQSVSVGNLVGSFLDSFLRIIFSGIPIKDCSVLKVIYPDGSFQLWQLSKHATPFNSTSDISQYLYDAIRIA
jgi:hypothetical protein